MGHVIGMVKSNNEQAKAQLKRGEMPATCSLSPLRYPRWILGPQGAWGTCRSTLHRNPLQAVISQNDAAQNLLGVTEVSQAGLDAGRNVAGGRMHLDLSQGLKFKVA